MKLRNKKWVSVGLIWMMFIALVIPGGYARGAERVVNSSGFRVLDERFREIAPGAEYRWYSMEGGAGKQKVHTVSFHPDQAGLSLQPGLTNGKVYGMEGVTKMAADADSEGNRVVAAMNGDFYDMSTGIPLGLFMGEGEILNSSSKGQLAFGLKRDGTTVYGKPEVHTTVTAKGTSYDISSINRLRGANDLVLYTSDFHTSTKTNDLGVEVIANIVSGEVKSGQTLTVQVDDVINQKGDHPLREDQVILSAEGTAKSKISQIQPGDEMNIHFQLSEGWEEVHMAIGGSTMLVIDGVAQTGGDSAKHPRSAIGTKEDGSMILLEIDGRQPGFSEGVSLAELGQIMLEMGAVQAMNLDGGGSSTFVMRDTGDTDRQIMNSPSDGGERKTSNGILLVNTAAAGTAEHLVIQPSFTRVLTGSSYAFAAKAVDASLHPTDNSDRKSWHVTAEVGTMDENGQFAAGEHPGQGTITAETPDGIKGTAKVEVVDELTDLLFREEVRTFTPGESVELDVTALRDGQEIAADSARLHWSIDGPIGTIDDEGVFTAALGNELSGTIHVSYGDAAASLEVHVGMPPVILEDFENGLGRYKPSSGASVKSTQVSIETEDEYVRFGSGALKLEYDFTGMPGTSGAYLQTTDAAQNIELPGYPEKISMWVYGDGKKHWLRAQLRDAKGAIPINLVEQGVGVDWTGWKYIEADIPKGRTLPLTMDMPVRYMETSADKKDAGVLYVDQIRALYGPADDDTEPPILRDESPGEGETVHTSRPQIAIYGEDAGYDPAQHGGTTLIDPDHITMELDGQSVTPTLYPPEGKIYYTPNIPLVDGIHQARVTIRDLSGNRTSKEWTFQVQTDGPQLTYRTSDNLYAGETYTVDIHASQISRIDGGHIEFQFDPNLTEDYTLIRGAGLSEEQIKASTDQQTGRVRVEFTDIAEAGVTAEEVLAQVQYHLKKEAAGNMRISFQSGSIRFTDTGEMVFPFFGLPLTGEIRNQLSVTWNEHGVMEGEETTFTVMDEAGQRVSGAAIYVDGEKIGDTNEQGTLATRALTENVKVYEIQSGKDEKYSRIKEFTVSQVTGSLTPFNINIGMGADPKTERRFTWHTHPSIKESVVEITRTEPADFSGQDVIRIGGDQELFQSLYDKTIDKELLNGVATVRVHEAVANGLEPGTEYSYRVGDGSEHVSRTGTFRTAEVEGDKTTFLYMADSQASTEKEFDLWGNTVRQAVYDVPDSEFMVHTGDMVDKGFFATQWNLWFNKAQDELMNTTIVAAVGNHEVMGTRGNDEFLAYYNQPGGGVPGLEGSNFSYDYKNIHFVVLNSEDKLQEQKEWLQQDLAASTKEWNIAIFHRGPYGSIYDSADIRESWGPVLEQAGVDLILNGHDHVYLRTFPMMNGEKAEEGKGSTYVIAGSTGPKFYPLTKREWQQVTDEEQTQMYSAVTVEGDELSFVTKTVSGRVVDEFTLHKNKTPSAPAELWIDEQNIQLGVGQEKPLHVTAKPQEASTAVTWSVYSSDPEAVVSISEAGRIHALEPGQATIRATSKVASGVYAETKVTVVPAEPGTITSIALTGKETLKVGETDQTVTYVVYSDDTRSPLTSGVIYRSSRPEVASINTEGSIMARSSGTTVISAVYEELESAYELTVTSDSAPGGGDEDMPPTEGSNGNSGVETEQGHPQDPELFSLTAEELRTKDAESESNQIILNLTGDIDHLELPGDSSVILQKASSIRINTEELSIVLPKEALRLWAAQLPDGTQSTSTLRLEFSLLNEMERRTKLESVQKKANAELTGAGEFVKFGVQWITLGGKVPITLKTTDVPLEVTFNKNAFHESSAIHPELVGMYFFGTNGPEYKSSRKNNGELYMKLNQFGTYGLLEWDRSYDDVSKAWILPAVKKLSALHIVEGTNDNRVDLTREVTRAEFISMIVRLLQLENVGKGSMTFTDVEESAWYAEAVYTAASAGLVTGVTLDEFQPGTLLKRQEMAVILLRAYEYVHEQSVVAPEVTKVTFDDLLSAPAWVQKAVYAATHQGILKGVMQDGQYRFYPERAAKREDAIQAIYQFIQSSVE